VDRVVVLDIGPEISKKGQRAPRPDRPKPETWESIEQAARHLLRGNAYPGIHYYRWWRRRACARARMAGFVWKWHPSIKERRVMGDVDWWGDHPRDQGAAAAAARAESMVLDADVAQRMARELPRARRRDPARRSHAARGQPRSVLDALALS